MIRLHLRLRDQQGFSLIELLVAMTILMVGVAGTIAMLDRANARTVENRAREAGTALAREVVERSRSLPYTSVTSAGLPTQLQAMEGLADSDPGRDGWQIDRRGVRFTVDVNACSVDDGKDQFGVRDGASWCAGGGTGTGDSNPDDYKRVTVALTWEQPDAKGRVREQTLLNSPGNAAGPAVTVLAATAPTGPDNVVRFCGETGCPSSVGFTITTSSTPATVSWTVDGAQQGTATGSGTSWGFTWPISTLTDGDYLIGARAYDRQGRSGATRVQTIKLNRFKAAKPRNFVAGRNDSIVDLEWTSNSERDIIGYRVYRQLAGDVPVQVGGTCADAASADRTRRNHCYDASPPAGEVTYYVHALDLGDDNLPRLGPESDRVTVTASSTPPGPVTGLRRTGSRLEWAAPAGNPPAAFYRIYRDGVAYANRYARTSETSWTDNSPTGTHTYAVTAVSAQLAESRAVQLP